MAETQALTHRQTLVLTTLQEHAADGGNAIGVTEINRELDRRHNRTMSYDSLHGVLNRLVKRGYVKRDKRRPARYSILRAGARRLG